MSKELDRIRRNLGIESLWVYILRILKDDDSHAYALVDLIESSFGFRPGRVTVYKVLYLLESHGFVSSRNELVGNRNRRIYSVSRNGLNELDSAFTVITSTLESLL